MKLLDELFIELEKGAYNVEYHYYEYKQTNQIIRTFMEKLNLENEKNATLELHLIAKSGYESKETVKISPNQWEEILRVTNETQIDYKSKYEKCIEVIKRFDAGIIGMYDL